MQYLLRVRLNHARQLIEAGELRLHEAAEARGFATPRTLNRAFGQRFGLAPSKWAKAHRPASG